MEKEMCLYEPGETHLQTIFYNTEGGKELCPYSKKRKEDLMAAAPHMKYMTVEAAMKEIEKAREEKYIQPWQEISKDDFHEMLNILPPMHWQRYERWEALRISEFTAGNITGTYVRVDGKYYRANRRVTTTYPNMLAEIEAQFKETENGK